MFAQARVESDSLTGLLQRRTIRIERHERDVFRQRGLLQNDKGNKLESHLRSVRQAWSNAVAVALLALLAGIIFFLIYLGLDAGAMPKWAAPVVPIIFKELSFACYIAAVLSVSVEHLTQKRHERLERRFEETFSNFSREIAGNVLRAVVAKNLPESVVQQLEGQVFRKTLFRPQSCVTYVLRKDFETIDGKKRPFVIWKQHQSFQVTNQSDELRTYPLLSTVSLDDGYERFAKVLQLRVDGVSISEGQEDKDGRTYVFAKSQGNDSSMTVQHTINITPGATRDVEVQIQGAGPAHTWEMFVTILPIDRFKLSIRHEPGEFDISAITLHPGEARRVACTDDMMEWEIQGLLPGQGMAFKWRAVDGTAIMNRQNPERSATCKPTDAS